MKHYLYALFICLPLLACAEKEVTTTSPAPIGNVAQTQAPTKPVKDDMPVSKAETAKEDADVTPAAPATPAIQQWVAGTHYEIIDPPQPTRSPSGLVEVTEVFMYACPHCYSFEPFINSWKKQHLKPGMRFLRLPAMYNRVAVTHAKAYLALAAMGGPTAAEHRAIFDAIHVQKNNVRSLKAFKQVLAGVGTDIDEFTTQYNSFDVDNQLRQAENLGRSYGVNSVPALVINGRYRTTGAMAGTEANLSSVINYLVDLERQRISAN